ncbi:hypothetical protein HYH03_004884 [Edaphochlamys debaryana]|uniref:PKD/REJ-like domain-containing protein n=1 Tax=Edaphochlamys debaryana TaxID=47281 RepID=A0A835YAL7_9CHLO|nr:hypothetical protein HYH03_004884 [Edaphochlamys debaryana]|eukprot:KAG2497301.1 hypothetical protein HYH03_004884 [Edaphochlamys debaryana]
MTLAGCTGFSAISTPQSPEDCTAEAGCALTDGQSGCVTGCAADVMQAVSATFTLSSDGVVQESSLVFKTLPTPTHITLAQLLTTCPAAAAEGASTPALSQDIVRLFATLARQANQRFADVSEEATLMGTSTTVRRADPTAPPTSDDETVSVQVPYALNQHTEVSEAAADGSRLVTQRQFVVPTDEAYELMTHGTADVAGGGMSRAFLSRAGQVLARLDSMVTEVPLPAGTPRGAVDPATGKAQTVVEAVLLRIRFVLLMARNPTASTAGTGGPTGGADGTPAAQQLADSLLPNLLSSGASDFYPGGYGSFIPGWKQQLAENARRRRSRRMQDDTPTDTPTGEDPTATGGDTTTSGGETPTTGSGGDTTTTPADPLDPNHKYTGSLFNKDYGFSILGFYSGIKAHVDVESRIDRLRLDEEGLYTASDLKKTATASLASFSKEVSSSPDATEPGGDTCETYKDDNTRDKYENVYTKSINLATFQIGFAVVKLTFSLDAEFNLYNGLGGCSHGAQPAYATGGGMSGALKGTVTGGVGIGIASITGYGEVTLVKPSVTAATYWTAAMTIFGKTDDPMCSALTLTMSGMGFRVGYTTHVIFIGDSDNELYYCDPSVFMEASTEGKVWGCDTTTQTLTEVTSPGVCTPDALGMAFGHLAPDGRSLTIGLSTSAMPLINVPCTSIFDETTNALLSTKTMCTALFNILLVKLSGMETFTPTTTLTMSASTALVGALSGGAVKFTGSVTLTGCSNACSKPVASLTGPAVIGVKPCIISLTPIEMDTLATFDASASFDPTGRALKSVTWSYFETLPSGGGGSKLSDQDRNRLDALMTSASDATAAPVASRLKLSLTSSQEGLLAQTEAQITFFVIVTSWLGTDDSKEFAIKKPGSNSEGSTQMYADVPALTVSGGPTQTFLISSGIRLEAQSTSTCSGRIIVWSWTSSWSGMPTGEDAAKPLLHIAGPVSATHGQAITIKAKARFSDMSATDPANFATATVTLTALGQPPVAVLTGPNGDVSASTAIVLVATGSTDPAVAAGETPAFTYTWECKRSDFPVPCFKTSDTGDQATTAGKWSIPAGLLSNDVWHEFIVTVAKTVEQGAVPLQASTSLKLRLKAGTTSFPRGSLQRLCTPALCGSPHSIDQTLGLMLVLAEESISTVKTVTWASAQAAAVADLEATDGPAAGMFLLSIPPASLSATLTSITVDATMTTADGATGMATITVPLNSAPYCLDASTPASGQGPCLEVSLLGSDAPYSVAKVRAVGWADAQDATSALQYEFGLKLASTAGGAKRERPQQVSAATEATLYGLPGGDVTLYVCVIDTKGARGCSEAVVGISTAQSDVTVTSFERVDVPELKKMNNPTVLLQAASHAAGLFSLVTSSSTTELRELVATRSASLVEAIAGSATLSDPLQAQQAVSVIETVATAASPFLADSTKQTILAAAKAVAAALPTDASGASAVGADFVTRICRILGVSMAPSTVTVTAPATTGGSTGGTTGGTTTGGTTTGGTTEGSTTGGTTTGGTTEGSTGGTTGGTTDGTTTGGTTDGSTTTPTDPTDPTDPNASTPESTESTGARRRRLADIKTELADLLSTANSLGNALGLKAAPGGTPLAAGDNGVFVSAAGIATPATAGGSTTTTLSAGPAAAAPPATSSSSTTTSGSSTSSTGTTTTPTDTTTTPTDTTTTPTDPAAGDGGMRRSLADSTATDATVQLVLAGASATSAAGASIDVTFAPSTSTSLASTLSSALPTGTAVLGGLTAVTWNPPAGSTAAAPTLDGTSSYLQLQLPAPGYDAAKGAVACLLYDATAATVTGNLKGVTAGSAPATTVSYDSTTGRVTCKATVFGYYLVAQSGDASTGTAAGQPAGSTGGTPTTTDGTTSSTGGTTTGGSTTGGTTDGTTTGGTTAGGSTTEGSTTTGGTTAGGSTTPATTTLTLTQTFAMDVSKISTRDGLEAFKTALQASLAAVLGVPASSITISSVDTTSSPGAVVVQSATVLDAAASARDPAAALQADTLAKLPADFKAAYFVTAADTQKGATGAGPSATTQSGPTGTTPTGTTPTGTNPDVTLTTSVVVEEEKKFPVGAVVGGVVGGVCALVIAAVATVIIIKHNQAKVAPQPSAQHVDVRPVQDV